MEAWRIYTLFPLSLILTSTAAAAAAASASSASMAAAPAGFGFRVSFTSQLVHSPRPPANAYANAGDASSYISHLGHSVVHEITPDQVYSAWLRVRAKAIAPALQAVVWLCMVMSVMLVVEATYMALVSLAVKILGWRPERQYKWEVIGEDEEKGSSAYPRVLVQIPMYNEIEVFANSTSKSWGFITKIFSRFDPFIDSP